MADTLAVALYVVVMAAVIVGVDVAFFRNHFPADSAGQRDT
jgi:hypothetical protein